MGTFTAGQIVIVHFPFSTLREKLEDLNDYLDVTEARVRDEGKPRLTHNEVKKRYGLK